MGFTLVDEDGFVCPGSSTQTDSFNETLQEDDMVIVAIACDAGSTPYPAMVTSGYTEIDGDTDASRCQYAAYYKFMGASPDTGLEIDGDSTLVAPCVWQVWRGVDTSDPFDATVVAAQGGSGAPNPPSISGTEDALCIAMGFLDDDNATVTAPSGYSNDIYQQGGAGSGATCTVMMASKVLTSTATEDPAAFGIGADNDAWSAITFSLNPAAESSVVDDDQGAVMW